MISGFCGLRMKPWWPGRQAGWWRGTLRRRSLRKQSRASTKSAGRLRAAERLFREELKPTQIVPPEIVALQCRKGVKDRSEGTISTVVLQQLFELLPDFFELPGDNCCVQWM